MEIGSKDGAKFRCERSEPKRVSRGRAKFSARKFMRDRSLAAELDMYFTKNIFERKYFLFCTRKYATNSYKNIYYRFYLFWSGWVNYDFNWKLWARRTGRCRTQSNSNQAFIHLCIYNSLFVCTLDCRKIFKVIFYVIILC